MVKREGIMKNWTTNGMLMGEALKPPRRVGQAPVRLQMKVLSEKVQSGR